MSTAWVWIHAYQNILITQAFWQALLWPRIILCSPLPLPLSRHNHTCLILSNLSSILANQLSCCALFHNFLSYPPPCSYPIFPLFLHLYLVVLSPVMASGSTLTRPSARAQTNQSRVVLFHKDQKQLVSSHVSRFFLVCPCCPICCLITQEVHNCLPDFFL